MQEEIEKKLSKKKSGNTWKIKISLYFVLNKQAEHVIIGLIDQKKSSWIYWTLQKSYWKETNTFTQSETRKQRRFDGRQITEIKKRKNIVYNKAGGDRKVGNKSDQTKICIRQRGKYGRMWETTGGEIGNASKNAPTKHWPFSEKMHAWKISNFWNEIIEKFFFYFQRSVFLISVKIWAPVFTFYFWLIHLWCTKWTYVLQVSLKVH